MNEQWRRVLGASMYEVSDLGRVRSYYNKSGQPVPHILPGTPRNGYARVRIYADDGGQRFRVVHRLVAEAFLGVPLGRSNVVRHLDDDKTNNRVDNLAWGTQADNADDARRNGRYTNARKTHCPQNHPYDETNTYVRPDGRGRTCRTCKEERQRARRAHARNLLDITPAGSEATLREMVQARIAELEATE